MQAAVERVIRSFGLKQPMSDDSGAAMHDGAAQDHATQLAAQLLENYKGQLARRGSNNGGSQQG